MLRRSRIEKEAENTKVVVVSAGDPIVAELGKLFSDEVEPGISGVQVDTHTKRFENLCSENGRIWSGFADEISFGVDYSIVFVRRRW